MAKRKAKSPVNDQLKRIKDHYAAAVEAWRDQYERGRDEVAFCDSENQWDAQDRMARENKGRPCITVDRMTPFLDQLANDQRQNRQAIDVHPVDDHGDVETAEVISGLIRHIEYDSNADVAYDTGFMAMLRGGIGFIRVYLDYCEPTSFDQDIKIGRIEDPFRVYLDPNSTEPDGCDAMWGCIESDMTLEEFKRRFPNADSTNAQSQEWQSLGPDDRIFLADKDRPVRVLEYFEKEGQDITLCLLPDGSIVKKEDVPEGIVPKRERTSTVYTVKQTFANALEILEETTFPGEYIPIIPIYGQELITDGKRQYFGLVNRLMGVQKMVNYQKSSLVETIALAPKAPWLIAAESVEGFERQWESANTANYAYLPFNAMDERGNALPVPQRVMGEPAIAAIAGTLQGSEEDLKAVTGMYDPSMGREASGQSGVAIRSLQHQGQLGNFHFQDNLSRSIRHLGRIIIGLIPLIYDAPRTVRIVKEDDTQETIRINEQQQDPKQGKPLIYDLTAGKYDVVVTSGPSYSTRRAENLAVMMDMMRALPPQVSMVLADLVVSQMDTPIAKQIQERLKKMLPPQLQDDPQNGQPPIPPQVQAQMQQLGEHAQQQEAAMHDLMNQLARAKQEKESKQAEIDARIKVAEISAEASVTVAEMNAKSKADSAMLSAQLDRFQSILDAFIAKDATLDDHAHEYAMASDPAVNGQMQMGQPAPSQPPAMPSAGGKPIDLSGGSPAGDSSPV